MTVNQYSNHIGCGATLRQVVMPAAVVVVAVVLTTVAVAVRAVVGGVVVAVATAVAVEDLNVEVSPVHFEQPSFPSVVTAVVVTVAAVFVVVVAAAVAVVVTAVASVPDPACAGAFAVPHHKHSQYQVFVLVLDLCTELPASLTVLSKHQPAEVGSHIYLSSYTENKDSSYHHRKETAVLPSHTGDILMTKYLT